MLTSGVFGYLADYLLWWLLLISLFVHTWCFFRFFPRKKYRGPRLVLGNALIFMCMLGVVAIAAESYLRFVYIDTDSFGMSLPARRWFAVYTKLNSQGCRDIEDVYNALFPEHVEARVGEIYSDERAAPDGNTVFQALAGDARAERRQGVVVDVDADEPGIADASQLEHGRAPAATDVEDQWLFERR